MRPLRIVDSPEFRNLLHTLDPRFIVPGRKQFADVIFPQKYAQVKTLVTEDLRNAEKVALTTDSWTTRVSLNVNAISRVKDLDEINDKHLNTLSDYDICLAEEVVLCLKPLKVVITILCTESVPTTFVTSLSQLIYSLFQCSDDDSLLTAPMKRVVIDYLQDVYGHQEDNPTIAAPLIHVLKPYLSFAMQECMKSLPNVCRMHRKPLLEFRLYMKLITHLWEIVRLSPLPQPTEQLCVSTRFTTANRAVVCVYQIYHS
ncbi:hypothetical protein CHS0354_029664 [Potamilus streckersoni]|uniref:Uncharacterized protein n=1 Tax=Potamilus streckersoni TaxID=2493646 RepID=A0AAE0RTP0_9BIVA|nr:hypothetical protein CHS0354_029664 [Potamilus streckersoni]